MLNYAVFSEHSVFIDEVNHRCSKAYFQQF